MALGGCYTCLKYLMFVFNFIFWLIGCCLLGVGIWAKVDVKTLFGWIEDAETLHRLNYYAYGFIVVGSVILVLGFLGCCGAIRESQCMLATFFVFLFIIFAALVTIGVYAYFTFFKDQKTFEKQAEKELTYLVDRYNQTEHRDKLNEIHIMFQKECCGSVQGDMKKWRSQAIEACGANFESLQGCAKWQADRLYKKGKDVNQTVLIVIVAVALSVATIMLLGMIFSMMLCCAVRESMA